MASNTINLEDNICPICLYIYIQPVTMPCDHELCLICFKQNVEEANFCCPLCRTRISTWARRTSKKNALVNQKRWEEIQSNFPDKVKKRLEGNEEEDDEMRALNVSIKLAEPGEIRNEYEEQLKKLREQRAKERQTEQEASERLIQQLQEEEMKKREVLEQIQKQDEVLARELSQVDSSSDSRTRSTVSTSDSRSSVSMESFMEKIRDENNLSKSPYPYRCLTPISSGNGKLCVDKDKVLLMEEKFQRRKIRKDKNLITTQDVANLEESFRQNRSRGASNCDVIDIDSLHRASASSHTLTLTNIMSTASLNQNEILNQMSEDLDININLIDADDDIIHIRPSSPALSRPVVSCKGDAMENTDLDIDDEEMEECRSRSASAQSNDSITIELNHFRPIRLCPLTPPRKLPSGKVVEPQLIRTTPRNLNKVGIGSPVETNLSDIDAGSPIMQRRLSELAEERKDQVVRMSKSTSTGVSARDDNENRNPQDTMRHQSPRLNIRFSNTSSRSVEFKDISNSPLQKRKFDFSNNIDDDSTAKRKLLIPLEPDLTENDVTMLDPFISVLKPKPSESANMKTVRNKLSRKNRGKPSRVRYCEDSLVNSPQPSIEQWIKRSDKMDKCRNSKETNDGLMVNGRDEVDGATHNGRHRKSKYVLPSHSTTGSMDKFVSPVSGGIGTSLSKTRRARRALRRADFIYNDSVKCTDESDSNDLTDVHYLRVSKSGKSKTVVSNDSSNDGFCSDGGSESSDDFLVSSPKKRRRKNIDFSSICEQSPKGRKQLETNKPFRSKPVLKSTKNSSINKKVTSSSSKRGGKQNYTKTMHDFFMPTDKKTRAVRQGQHQVELDEDLDMIDCVVDQEEKDRLMALELQKQFQLEEKLNLNSLRFKGSKDEYSFRTNRRRTTVIDA